MSWVKYTGGIFGILVLLLFVARSALAVPTFQVYVSGAVARDTGADDPTWIATDSTFDLILVGTYQQNTESLAYGTLVVSVPQGQTGTITISSPATLLTTTRITPFGGNPGRDAEIDLVSNIPGNDGFTTKDTLPGCFSNSYPFQNDTSDFLIFDVGNFSGTGPIFDYETRTNAGTPGSRSGQEKRFDVSISGFSWAHFDLYGYENKVQGHDAWQMNPCSHDAAFFQSFSPVCPIPAPGTIILGAIGIGVVAWLRTRRMF